MRPAAGAAGRVLLKELMYNLGMILSQAISRAVNFRLRPERREVLRAFAGRVVALRGGPLRAMLRISESGEFSPVHSAVDADAEMELAPDFLRAALSGEGGTDESGTGGAGGVGGKFGKGNVSGDPELLRAVGEAFRGARMDWESSPAGAPVALSVRAVARAAEVWLPRMGAGLAKAEAVAAPETVSQFNRRVSELSRGVSRLESAVSEIRRMRKGESR